MERTKTVDIKRVLPSWAKVVKNVNDTPLYNMSILDNIMSWNQNNLDTPAFDYFGNDSLTYGKLPEAVSEYACGLRALGIGEGDVVTLCLPVSIENVVLLFALDYIGAISNNVNYLFLKNNYDLYTRQKGSKVLITLDAYLPSFVDDLESSGTEKVILTNLFDYLPENNKHVFDDKSKLPKKLKKIFDDPERIRICMEKVAKIRKVAFIPLAEMRKLGRAHFVPYTSGPVDIERDVSYSYTSGTTGAPKCIVYKEGSANAFIEMHIGVDTLDYVGERVLLVIPMTHATGERVTCYTQLAKGKTLMPQPIYNKDTFGEDLMRSRADWVVAAASFYLAGVAQGLIAPDALKHLQRPASGGEPVPESNVKLINEWLAMNGCEKTFALGGGAAEDGSGTLFTYLLTDEATRSNKTGYPLAPHIRVKLLDAEGNEVKKGQRGYFYVSSPAAADRYLNNESATQKRWFTDEDGIRWGVTGDIAVQNEDDSYSILGRADDSYVDEHGNRVYLFDIEYSLDADDPVIEWEINAFKTDTGHAVVAQVVLKKEFLDQTAWVVRHLCDKYHLDAVKIYPKFENSDVTGKRDFKRLQKDCTGYLAPGKDGGLWAVDFVPGKQPVRKPLVAEK